MPELPSVFTLTTASLTLSLIVSLLNVYNHLTHFHEPRFQLYVVRIILIVPVYAIQTYLSILMPNSSLIFNALRDCYEAYVLYLFMQLLIQYLGGEQRLIAHFELQGKIKHPWPLTHRLRPIKLSRTFFRRIKQGTLQFVVLKPFISVVALVLHMEGFYEEGNFSWKMGYLYSCIITNISLTVSMYALVLFYIASEERLQIYKPFWKFVMVNSIISCAFWQSLAFSLMREYEVFGNKESPESFQRAFHLENCLLLFEISLVGIAHYFAFSYKEFVDLNKTEKPILKNLGEVTKSELICLIGVLSMCQQIFNMKDLIEDAKSSFVDEEEQMEHPMKVFSNLSQDTEDEESRIFLGRTSDPKDIVYVTLYHYFSLNFKLRASFEEWILSEIITKINKQLEMDN